MPALTAVAPALALTEADLAEQSEAFERLAREGATPHEVAEAVLRWGVNTFGDRLCLTASMTDAVLLHLTHRVRLAVEVVFVDTGYHFDETWDTVGEVIRRYRPSLRIVSSSRPRDDLWRTDPDGCCAARKVAPLEEVLAHRDAWIAGLRRADGPSRAHTPYVGRDHRGLVKLAPLAGWSDEYIAAYIERYDVPVNPLLAKGYPSIGCWPCTKQVADGDDQRSGRWSGQAKTECGLHLAPLP
jgi:phosphoadenosine phosphosulfate reductase